MMHDQFTKLLSKQEDIEQLIAAENDPKQRSVLIVLNSLSTALLANTETIERVSDKIDAHLTTFEAKAAADTELLNKGRGAWKILAWALSIAQGLVLALGMRASDALSSLQLSVAKDAVAIESMDRRLDAIEQKGNK